MRAIWSGAISFGLVTIPVQLFTAGRPGGISFHQLHQTDQARIRYVKFCGRENKPVPNEEITKAYEYQRDRYVTLSDEELAAADPVMARTIDILKFVETGEIDPVYFEKPYYLAPQPGGEKAYLLLAKALTKTGRVAIGKCVIRTKQYLVTLRPRADGLVMETMRYPDEIEDIESVLRERPATPVTDQELELAESLINQLAGKFEPREYRDEYREKIMRIVDQKVAGEEVVAPAPAPTPAPVVDLVAALKSSLEEEKKKKAA
jgi:DNA end-binding protein Ku